MRKIAFLLLLIGTCLLGRSQNTLPENTQLEVFSINGYRYPVASLNNLMWCALNTSNTVVDEMKKFDYQELDATQEGCPFFNSGDNLPEAKFSVVKCSEGYFDMYWVMNNGRRDRNHPSDRLHHELEHYGFKVLDLFTRQYRIKYGKWFVVITVYRDLSQEVISIRTSTNPID